MKRPFFSAALVTASVLALLLPAGVDARDNVRPYSGRLRDTKRVKLAPLKAISSYGLKKDGIAKVKPYGNGRLQDLKPYSLPPEKNSPKDSARRRRAVR